MCNPHGHSPWQPRRACPLLLSAGSRFCSTVPTDHESGGPWPSASRYKPLCPCCYHTFFFFTECHTFRMTLFHRAGEFTRTSKPPTLFNREQAETVLSPDGTSRKRQEGGKIQNVFRAWVCACPQHHPTTPKNGFPVRADEEAKGSAGVTVPACAS